MYLCIDTATKEAGITLVSDEQSYGYLPLEENHFADSILEHIDALVQKAGKSLENLKAVFVVVGPGSFTGLRVGVAVANQFAHQLNIPIVGLRAEEFYAYRTEDSDALYLQSMNRSEVYTKGGVVPIENLEELEGKKWLGMLSESHKSKLQHLHELHEILDIEKTWLKVIQGSDLQPQKKYDLLEPFYGKEPTITKSKRKLSI